jgi:hypothetical protein
MGIEAGVLLVFLRFVAGANGQVPATERLQAIVQSVDVPAGERLILKAAGEGVQIYRCDRQDAAASWTLVAPEAKLRADGVEIGSHSAGPMWKHRDGSTVWGEMLAKAPSPHANSIPLLLLKAARNEGQGVFSRVNFIQRMETRGGIAPDEGCDADHAGAEIRLPYTAVYLFYAAADAAK